MGVQTNFSVCLYVSLVFGGMGLNLIPSEAMNSKVDEVELVPKSVGTEWFNTTQGLIFAHSC